MKVGSICKSFTTDRYIFVLEEPGYSVDAISKSILDFEMVVGWFDAVLITDIFTE